MLIRIERLQIDHDCDHPTSLVVVNQQTTMKELTDLIVDSSALESGKLYLRDISFRIIEREDDIGIEKRLDRQMTRRSKEDSTGSSNSTSKDDSTGESK